MPLITDRLNALEKSETKITKEDAAVIFLNTSETLTTITDDGTVVCR